MSRFVHSVTVALLVLGLAACGGRALPGTSDDDDGDAAVNPWSDYDAGPYPYPRSDAGAHPWPDARQSDASENPPCPWPPCPDAGPYPPQMDASYPWPPYPDAGPYPPPVWDAGYPPPPSDAGYYPFWRKLDILFMVDGSNSMEPKQVALRQQFPYFMQALTGQMAAFDLHLGIVTADLGAGQFTPPSCDMIGGDQGMLQNTPTGPTCSSARLTDSSSRFLIYGVEPSGMSYANFTGRLDDAFACYAAVGTGGCGFEHQLASVRAALDGCNTAAGCRQRANLGFLRPDAYLAVILLTDEDDCSAPMDSTLFDPSQTALQSPLGPLTSYRCFEFGNLCNGAPPGRNQGPRQNCQPGAWDPDLRHRLTPVEEFAQFLRGLKPYGSRRVYVSVIGGPPAPVQVGVDANGYPDLQPACYGALGTADPATRLNRFVSSFDVDRASYNTICASDLQPALQRIGGDLARMLSGW